MAGPEKTVENLQWFQGFDLPPEFFPRKATI
jgi:hypothetical protein